MTNLVELLERAEEICGSSLDASPMEREAAYNRAEVLRELIKEYGDDAD